MKLSRLAVTIEVDRPLSAAEIDRLSQRHAAEALVHRDLGGGYIWSVRFPVSDPRAAVSSFAEALLEACSVPEDCASSP